MILLIVHHLRGIIGSIVSSNPFSRENVDRFRKIALLFTGVTVFAAIRGMLISIYIRSCFVIDNVDNPFSPLDLDFNGAFNDCDTESMRKGFHPDFAILAAGGTELSRYPIDVWIKDIERRKANVNFDSSRTEMDCRIVSIDVSGDCAAAKVEIVGNGKILYTYYLSLLKFEDGWKIAAKVYHQHLD